MQCSAPAAMRREMLVLVEQEFQSAAQGSAMCSSPAQGTGPLLRTAAAGGAGWFKAKAELFSHHKSLRTAQLFLCWTPQPAGFAALLLHPEIWGFPILSIKSKDFSTQPLFCCKCSPSEWQMHVGSKPLEFISLRDLKCQISANLK